MVTLMEIMETFENLVKSAMKRRGINQRELADAIGVTPAQVSRVLKGERGTTDVVLKKLSTFLGIPLKNIFEALGKLPPETDDVSDKVHQLTDLAKNVDEPTVDLAIAMLEAALKQKQTGANASLKPAK